MKRPKKPKAPRVTASLAVWERYEKRLKDWQNKIKQIDADRKKKEAIIQRARKLASAY